MAYQDDPIGTERGTRECSSRYEAVRAEVERVGARTVLDLGANRGYFSVRLADELGCEVTAVDDWPSLDGPGIKIIRKRLSPAEVETLGTFDVVLALAFLHHTDWRSMWPAIRSVARKRVIAEVPQPGERLRMAKARRELSELAAAVQGQVLATTSATRQPQLKREIRAVPPLRVGTVFSGSGNHTKTQERYGKAFEAELGYRPFPGSLNLRLDVDADFGPPQHELRFGKRRVYQMWRALIGGRSGHLMWLGERGHGPDCIEALAPVRLRDDLEDGSRVPVEVLW